MRFTGSGFRLELRGICFYIDYSVTEGAMTMVGTYMLDYQVNGRRTRRPDFPPGNRAVFPQVAPHNTYRCAGNDRVGQHWWVFIACETQAQFEALCALMHQPGLALDPKFTTNEALYQASLRQFQRGKGPARYSFLMTLISGA